MHAQRCNLPARTALAVIVFTLAVPAGAARATAAPEPSLALRNANEGIRNVSRELAAGGEPSESSLHNLRQNVEELVPAVDALERHRVSGTGVPGGRARFERGLRRAVAGAVVLVAALVRSGPDTPESERLLGLLRRLAEIPPSARSPDRPGAAYAAPGAAAQPVAYTHAATLGRSSSGWLAAAALLLTVAASGSFASITMSRWGRAPSRRRARDSTRRS